MDEDSGHCPESRIQRILAIRACSMSMSNMEHLSVWQYVACAVNALGVQSGQSWARPCLTFLTFSRSMYCTRSSDLIKLTNPHSMTNFDRNSFNFAAAFDWNTLQLLHHILPSSRNAVIFQQTPPAPVDSHLHTPFTHNITLTYLNTFFSPRHTRAYSRVHTHTHTHMFIHTLHVTSQRLARGLNIILQQPNLVT